MEYWEWTKIPQKSIKTTVRLFAKIRFYGKNKLIDERG